MMDVGIKELETKKKDVQFTYTDYKILMEKDERIMNKNG